MTKRMPIASSAVEYIEQRVEKQADSGCWIWHGPMYSNGYGMACFNAQRFMAHRFSYETLVGPIPDGLHLDHLCRVKRCVNPQHLEPVTARENLLRGMSPMALIVRSGRCAAGHEMSGANLYVSPKGARKCRICMKENRSRRYQRDKIAQGIPDRKPKGSCREPGCERPHYARGLCKRDYQRARNAA